MEIEIFGSRFPHGCLGELFSSFPPNITNIIAGNYILGISFAQVRHIKAEVSALPRSNMPSPCAYLCLLHIIMKALYQDNLLVMLESFWSPIFRFSSRYHIISFFNNEGWKIAWTALISWISFQRCLLQAWDLGYGCSEMI